MKKIGLTTILISALAIGACKSSEYPVPTWDQFREGSITNTVTVTYVGREGISMDAYLKDIDDDGHVDLVFRGGRMYWAVEDLKKKKNSVGIYISSETGVITPDLQSILDAAYHAGQKAGYALTQPMYEHQNTHQKFK